MLFKNAIVMICYNLPLPFFVSDTGFALEFCSIATNNIKKPKMKRLILLSYKILYEEYITFYFGTFAFFVVSRPTV